MATVTIIPAILVVSGRLEAGRYEHPFVRVDVPVPGEGVGQERRVLQVIENMLRPQPIHAPEDPDPVVNPLQDPDPAHWVLKADAGSEDETYICVPFMYNEASTTRDTPRFEVHVRSTSDDSVDRRAHWEGEDTYRRFDTTVDQLRISIPPPQQLSEGSGRRVLKTTYECDLRASLTLSSSGFTSDPVSPPPTNQRIMEAAEQVPVEVHWYIGSIGPNDVVATGLRADQIDDDRLYRFIGYDSGAERYDDYLDQKYQEYLEDLAAQGDEDAGDVWE